MPCRARRVTLQHCQPYEIQPRHWACQWAASMDRTFTRMSAPHLAQLRSAWHWRPLGWLVKPLDVLPLLLIALSGCGPGVVDGPFPIKDGYVFYETGGNGKTIEYLERNGGMRNVIPPRVDAYVVDGSEIVVARRPAKAELRHGVAEWVLLPTCEYWEINTGTHAVERVADASKWQRVQCDMGKSYGAQVERAR